MPNETMPLLNFYSNPAKNFIYFNNELLNGKKMQIYNIAGQLIKEHKLEEETIKTNISYIENGVYILLIENESLTFRSKFIKRN